jgi:hypothetical protein
MPKKTCVAAVAALCLCAAATAADEPVDATSSIRADQPAPRMNTRNTFEQPEAVEPAVFTGGRRRGESWVFELPAKSVAIATLN